MKISRPILGTIAGLALAITGTAQAANLTWNGGVSGDWQHAAGGWLDGISPANWNNGNPDSATFSGTGPTAVTVNAGGITVDDLSVTSGTYSIGGSGTLTLSNSTLDIGSGLTTTVSAALAGTTGLTKTGSGTLALSGTNKNYTGGTTINGGVIQIASAAAGALGSTDTAAVSLDGGALHTLFAGNTNVKFAINAGASGGELRNLGNDSQRWQFQSSTMTGSGTVTLSFGTNNTRFDMSTTTQSGFTGKWIIDSANNTNRFVNVGGSSNFGAGTGDDVITLQNTGTVLLRNVTFGSATQGITLGTGGGRMNVAGGSTATVAGKISGATGNPFSAGIENGSILILSNTNNAFAGNLSTVATSTTPNNTSVLRLGASGVIPDGASAGDVTIGSNTTLDLNGFDETINGLSGAGGVDNQKASGASTLSIGGNNTNSTFGGLVRNSGSSASLALAKVGTGTLTLTNTSNSFSGGITVAGGTLLVTHAAALGSGNLTLNATNGTGSGNRALLKLSEVVITGRTLTINPSVNRPQLIATGAAGGTWNGTITLTGSTSGNGNAEFTNDVGNGPLTVAGTVGGSLSSGAVTLRGTSTSNTLAATVNIGATPIEKSDSGTWTITSTGNTWGSTGISSGTLKIGANDALPSASNLSMANNTSLDLAGSFSLGNSRTGTLLLAGNATLDFGSTGVAQMLEFGDSSALGWSGFALSIANWESGSDQMRFGTSSSGLTPAQLANINFTGFSPGAQISELGFLTPIPEPQTAAMLGAGLLALFCSRRRRAG